MTPGMRSPTPTSSPYWTPPPRRPNRACQSSGTCDRTYEPVSQCAPPVIQIPICHYHENRHRRPLLPSRKLVGITSRNPFRHSCRLARACPELAEGFSGLQPRIGVRGWLFAGVTMGKGSPILTALIWPPPSHSHSERSEESQVVALRNSACGLTGVVDGTSGVRRT